VLKSVPTKRKLIIEIKGGLETVPLLKKKIEAANLQPEQIEIISFDLQVMIESRNHFDNYKVLWLPDLDYTWQTKLFSVSMDKGIAMANKYRFNGLNVRAGKSLGKDMNETVHAAGLLLYC